MGRVQRLAAQRQVTPYELSRNILQEAGYEITRREEKNPAGHRGYDVAFPCSIDGQQHQKMMRRTWLIELAELRQTCRWTEACIEYAGPGKEFYMSSVYAKVSDNNCHQCACVTPIYIRHRGSVLSLHPGRDSPFTDATATYVKPHPILFKRILTISTAE